MITYKGRLDLFSNYKRNPQNVDLYFTNVLNIKLAKILSLTWSLDMIYDDDVRLFGENNNGAALQLKSLVGIGLLVQILMIIKKGLSQKMKLVIAAKDQLTDLNLI